ncbi:cupredoxin domain-containing protein [Effusibacillus lacus]|nr:cupredoxin domain-containing protein [Effusibacillus lacus]
MIAIALISIGVMAGYTAYLTFRHKQKLTCMAAMMVAMTASMMSSILLGTVLGIYTNGQMLIPTVLAVSAGLAVGYVTGRPVSLMAAMDGMVSGVMGGMMGAMLGVMVRLQSPMVVIAFVNLIYFIVMVLLVKLIHEEVGTTERAGNQFAERTTVTSSKLKWYIVPLTFILLILGAKASETGALSIENLFGNTIVSTKTESPGEVKEKNGFQIVDVIVKKDGYSPEEIKVKAGVPVKIHFKKDYEGGCLSYVLIKDFDITQKLQTGTTTIEINPKTSGTYKFTCGMEMYEGTIIAQ